MSLKDITTKIIEDARHESAGVVKEIREEMEREMGRKDEEMAEAAETVEKRGAQKADKIREQAEFRSRMIEKNAVLEARQELIGEVFDAVKKKLAALDDEAFTELMVSALKESPRLEGAEVITSAKRRRLMPDAIRRAGVDYALSEKTLPLERDGFILSSATAEVNNTIESIVDSKREELEPEIVKRLFG